MHPGGAGPPLRLTARRPRARLRTLSRPPRHRRGRRGPIPIRTRTDAASYGASSSRHACQARSSAPTALFASPLASEHGTAGVVGHRADRQCLVLRGELGQLGRCRARGREVADRQHDLDTRREQPDAVRLFGCLGEYAANARLGGGGVALRQAQQGQARVRLQSRPTGLLIRLLSDEKSPLVAIHLRLLIKRRTGRVLVGRRDETLGTRAALPAPPSAQAPCSRKHFGAMDETLTGDMRLSPSGGRTSHCSAVVHSCARRSSAIS